jgi:hypothetical protein
MHPTQLSRLAIASQLLAFAIASAAPASADEDRSDALRVYGLTADQRLIAFDSDRPRRAREVGPIANLSGDARLVGIDFRPATGELYALGNSGGVYTLDPKTAVAQFRVQIPTALTGAAFGIDFNPTVDRLRVASDAGQNLRIDVTTGATTVDPNLNVGSPPAPALGVTGVAYTNNDADPNTGTTLFDLDTDTDVDALFIQAPANAGSLNLSGNLRVAAVGDVGFDVFTRLRNGRAREAIALAALTSDRTRLYEIDLITGEAQRIGHFRRSFQVIGLAIALDDQPQDRDSD